MELGLAIAFALLFSVTNGFHDAANAIATLVATRGARPGQAIVVAACFEILGAVVIGTAVAGTIAGIVAVRPAHVVPVVGAGLLGAVAWNLATWSRGLPSSSGHALVGGLAGAALADSGLDAVRWGGVDGLRPVGVVGALVALAVSPPLGLLGGYALDRLLRRSLQRASRRVRGPVRTAEWLMSAALAASHGANDGQKSMGAIAAVLLATGHTHAFAVPLWAKLGCGAALALGVSLGGWRIVRTVGRGIIRLAPVDGLASQAASTAVVLSASFAGGPVSTTHVVASSVVGVGGGRRRWRHVRWAAVRAMAFAWVTTIPAAAGLAAATLVVWRWAA